MNRLEQMDALEMTAEDIYGDRMGSYTGRCPQTGYVDYPLDWAHCGHAGCSAEFDADLEDDGVRCGGCGVGVCMTHSFNVPDGGRPWCAECVSAKLDDERHHPQAWHEAAFSWLWNLGISKLPVVGAKLKGANYRG